MRTFDILDPKAPLLGAKILEASAGTGKTFAIEHLFLRLLLETPLEIEGILAITYTRAAAREMRMRIRENLKKALVALRSEESRWPYLLHYLGSKDAIRKLESALAVFDSAQIFTIHGFCQRMLSEFSLEARSLQMEEGAPLGKALRADLLDFLEEEETLGPEQMQVLLKKSDLSRLCKDLLNKPVTGEEEGCFLSDCQAIAEVIRNSSYRHTDVREAFSRIESACKYTGFDRAEISDQLLALEELFQDPFSQKAVRRMLACKGSLFDFVSADNRKKGKEDLAAPPLFDWGIRYLLPLIEKSIDPARLFQRLRRAWQQPFEKLLEERGLFSPDYLLERMRRSLAYSDFAARVRGRYKAAIIDEFQDTDALQWEIFSKLFQELPLFYLVGDPKQSIYRFRSADLYTYYRARSSLGLDAHYSLDTNYRSSPELVGALNDLFGEKYTKPWLWLPGERRTEPYHPVKAGVRDGWNPEDGLKPLQFFQVDNLKEAAYGYIADQIERLRPHFGSLSSFAILVQSHQQAALIQDYLQRRSLPCAAKSRASLGSSLAMEVLEELFDALFFPRDLSAVKLFIAGPLVGKPFEEMSDLSQLFSWKSTLDRKGMAAFFREFLAFRWEGGASFYEKIAGCGAGFFRDFFQLLEKFVSKEPQSYEAIARIFREIEEADPEEDASARRRMDAGEDAIEILTMHTSKGLEFDVVFALGVATPTPVTADDREEAEAEKLRQLYVALTRAKRRLYIPLTLAKIFDGGEPPLELLWQRSKLAESGLGAVEKLIELNSHIGLDSIRKVDFASSFSTAHPLALIAPEQLSFPRPLGSIYSYSSLVQQEKGKSLAPLGTGKSIQTLPRGTDIGTLFHRIFERIFTEKLSIETIVQREVRFSELSEWEEVVLETVRQALSLPLLQNLDRLNVLAEVEFFFHEPPHFFKGCIDLLFLSGGRIYFLDWKTNWLESYSEESLRKAMDEHNYWMQASLYAEAIRRTWPDTPFGGAIYLFVRGGILTFEPEPFRLPQ